MEFGIGWFPTIKRLYRPELRFKDTTSMGAVNGTIKFENYITARRRAFRNRSVRRSRSPIGETIVNDFDPSETLPARYIDEIVLAALALKIVPRLAGAD